MVVFLAIVGLALVVSSVILATKRRGGLAVLAFVAGALVLLGGYTGYLYQVAKERTVTASALREKQQEKKEGWQAKVNELAEERKRTDGEDQRSALNVISYMQSLAEFARESLHTDSMKRLGFRGENGDLSMLRNGFLQMYWDRKSWGSISQEERKTIILGIWKDWRELTKDVTSLPVVEVVPGPKDSNTIIGKVTGLGEVAVYD